MKIRIDKKDLKETKGGYFIKVCRYEVVDGSDKLIEIDILKVANLEDDTMTAAVESVAARYEKLAAAKPVLSKDFEKVV